MSAIAALVRKDFRVIYRDRFLLFIAFYALILAALARVGVRWVPVDHIDLYVAPAVATFGTLLLGTVLGFALVEEREQGTWLLLRVLPVGTRTVFVYLSLTTGALSFVVSLAAAALYGYPVADGLGFVVMLVAGGPTAALMMLAIGALAQNKIEGLAVSKILSTAGLAPALVFVVPPAWQLIGAWCPLYWLYLGLLAAYAHPTELDALYWPGYPWWLSALMTMTLSAGGVAWLVRRYTRAAL